MTVLQMVKYNAKETVEVLRALLAMALRGELRGVALCYRKEDGTEEAIFTGAYKANPGHLANASMRLSLSLMRSNGELD